jgi:hypothetical protein
VQFEPQALHRSIDIMLSYHPEKMYLTHYGEVTQVAKLADNLHHSIDKQVDLTKLSANHGEQRHILLYDSLMNDFLKTLTDMGCTIPISRCRELLAFDVEINVQGLEMWWDRKMKSERHKE